jgi:hypothetical protein
LALTDARAIQVDVQVFIALRSLGPSGGLVRDLRVGDDGQSLWRMRKPLALLSVDQPPGAIGCGVGDPSPLARAGQVPGEQSSSDPDGWCFGLLRFDVTLMAGKTWQVRLDCPQHTSGNMQDILPGVAKPRPAQYEARAQAHLSCWQDRLSRVDLHVPDDNFRHAFHAGLQHMLTATVGDQARIAPLSYPLPWLRDSVFIIRCFDLAGFHDLARAATEYCARNDFFGGFGAEGDAPGEGLWALAQHYRITRDKAWLEKVYPTIRRKCEWLFRMRRTKEPIQVFVDTPTLAFTHAERNAGVICLAGQDGLIMGTMDHHIAVSWVNHWAICGLREAAYAARKLGLESDAATYGTEASELKGALEAFIERTPTYFEWERTVNSLLWPCRVWEDDPQSIAPGFSAWWDAHRGAGDDDYQPEPYWLYFELAQAHNALLLGHRERAWRVVQYRLRHQDLPGLYGWREGGDGVGTQNATQGVTLIPQLRGCHRFPSITPHGWSQAEMWLLQRAVLVEEWQGGLLLFAGVPSCWLTPNSRVAFRNLPTWYGNVSAELLVDEQARSAAVKASGIAAGTNVRVQLPTYETEATSGDDGSLSIHVEL